jgi:hypothetical protein
MGKGWAVAILLLSADAAPADPDRAAEATHRAEAAAPGVVVRFDPARVGPEAAVREAGRASRALRDLEVALEQRLDAPARLYLYRDPAELAARTGAPSAWGAFAWGERSIHAPLGAPLRHELTHLLARRFPGAAKDPGGLLREGLAAAMEETDRGIAVEDWAAVERRLGVLPSLGALRDSWPDGAPPEAHPYHAAGAFVRWLLATRGLAAVKDAYADPRGAASLLDDGQEPVEADWHASLDGRAVDPWHEAAVRRWFGLPGERLPDSLAAAAVEDLLEGERLLERFRLRRPGTWTADGDGLRGAGPADDFASLDSWGAFPAGAALRCAFTTGPDASLFLRVHRTAEGSDEAVFRPDGSFLTLATGHDALVRVPRVRVVPGRRTVAVLETRGRDARLYLDGWLVLEARGAFRGGGGTVGLGVRGGPVAISALEVLRPAP